MSATLEALSIAQLASLFNVQAAKPVKKFASKKAAIAALQKQEAEAVDIDLYQNLFDIAYAELLAPPVETSVDPSVETPLQPVETCDDGSPLPEDYVNGDTLLPVDPSVEAPVPPVDQSAAAPAPTAGGFQYLTREALKELAAADAAARAAYRIDRRKAARAARKAKKAPKAA